MCRVSTRSFSFKAFSASRIAVTTIFRGHIVSLTLVKKCCVAMVSVWFKCLCDSKDGQNFRGLRSPSRWNTMRNRNVEKLNVTQATPLLWILQVPFARLSLQRRLFTMAWDRMNGLQIGCVGPIQVLRIKMPRNAMVNIKHGHISRQ